MGIGSAPRERDKADARSTDRHAGPQPGRGGGGRYRPGVTREQVLDVAAALEVGSEQPLGRAMPGAVPGVPPVEHVEAVVGAELGEGVCGRPARLNRCGGIAPGVLAGNNSATALEVGIDRLHAELHPEDKTRLVVELRAQRRTAMVGDRGSDGPALTTADLGMAMAAMGTDVTVETADIALMGEDPPHLPLPLVGVLCLAAVVLVHEITGIALSAHGVREGRTTPLAASPTRQPSVELSGVLP